MFICSTFVCSIVGITSKLCAFDLFQMDGKLETNTLLTAKDDKSKYKLSYVDDCGKHPHLVHCS